MANEEQQAPLCSECGTNPLDTSGYPKWCKACRAKYKREYSTIVREMAETRGFAAGVEAFRAHLVNSLKKRGPVGMYKPGEMVAWISRAQIPRP